MAERAGGQDRISVVDLFAGCGGLTQGFHGFRAPGSKASHFKSVAAVEWDSAAVASYAVNFARPDGDGPRIVHGDISDWEPPWSPGAVDVVVGGPPCQGFSGLNRHGVGSDRNKLWEEFLRIVLTLQPKVFVIENVDRFLRSAEFSDLQGRLEGEMDNYQLVEPSGGGVLTGASGRGNNRFLLNAADFGAAQARRRAIVIGVRSDTESGGKRMRYPAPTHSRQKERSATEDELLVPGALSPWRSADEVFEESSRLAEPTTDLPSGSSELLIDDVSRRVRGPFRTSDLHITRNPVAVSRARYRAVPEAGSRKDLRGRYLCTVETTGCQEIVEKVGPVRDAAGALVVEGRYVVVEKGVATDVGRAITGARTAPAGSGRGATERFVVDVQTAEDAAVRGTLEYLSTPSWDAHESGTGDVMGRVRFGSPSVTIRTEFFKPEKGRYLHPTEDRPLTHYEAARLQGFPVDFKWCGSKTEIARQIGNAVPIPLAERIAASIYDFLRG